MSPVDCQRFDALQDRLLLEEEPLTAGERQWFDDHLVACADCGREALLWQTLQTARERLGPEVAPGPAPAAEVTRLLARAREPQRSRGRWRLSWALGPVAALLVAALGVGLWLGRGTGELGGDAAAPGGQTAVALVATLWQTQGIVRVDGHPARSGQVVDHGAELTTAPGALARLRFSDGSQAVLEGAGRLRLEAATSRELALRLAQGEVALDVPPGQPRRRVLVRFAPGWVEVVGTRFSVLARSRRQGVAVARGRVRVHPKTADALILRAGESWMLGRQGRPGRLGVAALAPAWRRRIDLHFSGAPTAQPPGRRRVAAKPIAGTAGALVAPVVSSPSSDRLVTDGRAPRPRPRRAARAAAVKSTAPSVAELLKAIRAQRSRGDWRGAVGGYRRLRKLHPKSPEARTTLVLMGQILLRHLGRPGVALRAFERYQQGGRGGSLGPEASWGRIGALGRLGQRSKERAAAKAFLKRYPGSIYAQQVRRRLGTLKAPASPHP